MGVYSALKKVYYVLLNAVTFGNGVTVTINNFKLKLPARYHRLFPRDYEASSFQFFEKNLKPGATILDIGAHIGLYSVFLATKSKGKVYSFEPTPDTGAVLRQTVAINKLQNNITVVPAAVSDKPGTATFYISKTEEIATGNSLVDVDFGENYKRDGGYEVEVVSIDDFVQKNNLQPSVLKIDAEGVELEVLRGAKNTFSTFRPAGILGVHPFAYSDKAGTLSEIWDLLKEYQLIIQMDGKAITKEEFCSKEDFVFDIEFLPA